MASNPDTLPADFFKGRQNPDTLPASFKGGKIISIDHPKDSGGGGRGRTQHSTPEQLAERRKEIETRPETLGGINSIGTGLDEIVGGTRERNVKRGVHNVITGGAELAAPLALPGIVAAPAAAAGTAAIGYAGGKAARYAGAFAGVKDEDVLNLLEDAGMAVGGYAGSRPGVRRATAELLPEKIRAKVGKVAGAYRGTKPEPTAPETEAPKPSIVKPDTYRARGERNPEDLGRLPGDIQPSRGPLQEPKSGVDAKKSGPGRDGGSSAKGDAGAIAGILKRIGTTKAEAGKMSPLEWRLVFSNAKLKELPHPDVLKAAIDMLQ